MCSPGAEENGSGHPELRFADAADVVRSQKATLKRDKERMHQACAPACYRESKQGLASTPMEQQETQQVQGQRGPAPDLCSFHTSPVCSSQQTSEVGRAGFINPISQMGKWRLQEDLAQDLSAS